MKKLALFTTLFLIFVHIVCPFFQPVKKANAEEQPTAYACALAYDVYLYAEESETSGLFCIPYTYYVKVISTGIDYSYVQYSTDAAPFQTVYGYCKTDQLFFVDFVPSRPFLYYTLDVTYTLDEYADFFEDDEVFSKITLTYAYYGDYTVGSSSYCYVCLNGKMGYLPKTMPVSYELNDDYISPSPNQPPWNDFNGLSLPVEQIVLIAVIILGALLITYYLLRSRTGEKMPVEEEVEF